MSFDRFMVARDAASNPKVKRMKRAGKETRWAWFHGVLAIAAGASPRGYLLVGGQIADEHDVAAVADVTLAEARSALKVGRELGMLVDDGAGREFVHDWDQINPAPKTDSTNADRQRRFRDRNATRNGPVRNGVVTLRNGTITSRNAPEVEVEVEGEEEEKQQQQRAHASEITEEVASILDDASTNGPVDRDKVTELIDKQPAKDHREAALETVAWSEREALQSVTKAYQHVLTNQPTVAPPPPQPEPPTKEAAAKWETARTALRAELDEGQFDMWIDPVVLLGVTDEQLVLGAPAEIRSWVTDRFATALSDALSDTPWRIDATRPPVLTTTKETA